MPISFTPIGTFGGDNASSTGLNLNNSTSLQFGPDGRLYVSERDGTINAFSK